MGATTHSYIIASRIAQGHEDWESTTLEERQSIIANYLKIKDKPAMQKYGNGHSHIDLLHHNDSEASLQSSMPHEHKHHSFRKHFSHLDNSTSEGNEDTESEGQDVHKHSIRRHIFQLS
jgi:hypothetical protein